MAIITYTGLGPTPANSWTNWIYGQWTFADAPTDVPDDSRLAITSGAYAGMMAYLIGTDPGITPQSGGTELTATGILEALVLYDRVADNLAGLGTDNITLPGGDPWPGVELMRVEGLNVDLEFETFGVFSPVNALNNALTRGDDVIFGSSLAEFGGGGAGDDGMALRGGNDTAEGGDGADFIMGQAGDDSLDGEDGNDTIKGGAGSDTIEGGEGDDRLDGGTGYDTVVLGFNYAPVTLNLENGTATGGLGTDSVTRFEHAIGSGASDTIYGTQLHGNRLEGGGGGDRLYGLAGRDTLLGRSGNDLLFGGTGVDSLYGGTEDDRLDGGAGTDYLDGGPGADTFVLHSIADTGNGPYQRDVIRDFDATEGDVIDLSSVDADILTPGDQGFVLTHGDFTGVAGQMLLRYYVVDGQPHTIMSMDVDGDTHPEGQIYIRGDVSVDDFIL